MIRSELVSETQIAKLDEELCSSQFQTLVVLLIIKVDYEDVPIVMWFGPKIN